MCFQFPDNCLEYPGIKFGTDTLGSMVLQEIGKEGIDGSTSFRSAFKFPSLRTFYPGRFENDRLAAVENQARAIRCDKVASYRKEKGRLDNPRIQLRYSGRNRLGFRSFFSLARTTVKIFRKSGNTGELLQNASNHKQSEESPRRNRKNRKNRNLPFQLTTWVEKPAGSDWSRYSSIRKRNKIDFTLGHSHGAHASAKDRNHATMGNFMGVLELFSPDWSIGKRQDRSPFSDQRLEA